MIYIGAWDDGLYAINATAGRELWNYTTGAGVHPSPAVVDGIVYVGGYSNNL